MKTKTTGLLFIGLGFGVILGGVVLMAMYWLGPDGSADNRPAPRRGRLAPEFSLNEVTGQSVAFPLAEGGPLMVNFWATWCIPCKDEMPLIQSYADQYAGELTVFAVNDNEPTREVEAFVEELRLDLPVLLDPGSKVNDLYRISAYPTTFFIDAKGVIQAVHIGSLSEDLITGYLAQIGVGD